MTDLTCRACGHRHTQADWEYQAGHCHACGAPLEIPHDDPSYAQWITGPKSKAAIELDQAAEIENRSTPDPGPLPDGAPIVTEEEEDEEDEEDDEPEHEEPEEHEPEQDEGVHVPEEIQVDETGRLMTDKPKAKKRKRKS